jgi:hypothetical protein
MRKVVPVTGNNLVWEYLKVLVRGVMPQLTAFALLTLKGNSPTLTIPDLQGDDHAFYLGSRHVSGDDGDRHFPC